MGTKNNPGKFDCYKNAGPDEPMFTLLGRDSFGASLVDLWRVAKKYADRGSNDPKLKEAADCANQMRKHCSNSGKVVKNVLEYLPNAMLTDELLRRGHFVSAPDVTFTIPVGYVETPKMIAYGPYSAFRKRGWMDKHLIDAGFIAPIAVPCAPGTFDSVPAGHRMTKKANGIPYYTWYKQGWSDAHLFDNGYMERIPEEQASENFRSYICTPTPQEKTVDKIVIDVSLDAEFITEIASALSAANAVLNIGDSYFPATVNVNTARRLVAKCIEKINQPGSVKTTVTTTKEK